MNSITVFRLVQALRGGTVFLGVVAVALLLLVVAVLSPGKSPSPIAELPWHIERGANGVRVFGLTLGHSTLAEAQNKFHEQAAISLFISDTGEFAAEAYFDRTNLSGLSAKVVLSAALPQAELQDMSARGLRISSLGSGRKVELHPDDKEKVLHAAIASLTYLPATTLDEALIVQRFGAPARRVREAKNDVLHLLYPQSGLDIALNGKNKAVLQYFPPQDFSALMAPLFASSATAQFSTSQTPGN